MAARPRRNSNIRVSTTTFACLVPLETWKYEQTQHVSRDAGFHFSESFVRHLHFYYSRSWQGGGHRRDRRIRTVRTLKLKSRTLFRHVAVSCRNSFPAPLLAHLTLLRLSVIICRYRAIESAGAIVRDRRMIFARDLLLARAIIPLAFQGQLPCQKLQVPWLESYEW